jgi:hypothetical protein
MSYRKLSALLIGSLVFLLVVSLVLICTWFYFFFRDKDTENSSAAQLSTKDSILRSAQKNDSLQKLYTAGMGRVDTSLEALNQMPDSLKADFDSRLNEFYKLRNEIALLLKNKSADGDLELARQKIGLLQQKIDELKNRTSRVEDENKRLNAILQQLTQELKGKEQKRLPAESKPVVEKSGVAPVFLITDIKIQAMGSNGETSQAKETEQISGSINLKNQSAGNSPAEIYVVVIQPDGKVLQGSAWETGSFETREGKKIYSSKIVFDYTKGESRKLNFSIRGEEFENGNYQVQVYQNGGIVARASKVLE